MIDWTLFRLNICSITENLFEDPSGRGQVWSHSRDHMRHNVSPEAKVHLKSYLSINARTDAECTFEKGTRVLMRRYR